MSIPTEAYPAIGAILAAVIAGAISFINIVLSKEQKISEFRQEWIDALRSDLSLYCGLTTNLFSFVELKNREGRKDLREYLEERHDDFTKINEVSTRIILRLNPDEHRTLLELIDMPSTDQNIKDMAEREFRKAHINKITLEAGIVLKYEWKRVKRGETIFLCTKWSSLAIALIAILFGLYHYL